jgi:hypothetical protein
LGGRSTHMKPQSCQRATERSDRRGILATRICKQGNIQLRVTWSRHRLTNGRSRPGCAVQTTIAPEASSRSYRDEPQTKAGGFRKPVCSSRTTQSCEPKRARPGRSGRSRSHGREATSRRGGFRVANRAAFFALQQSSTARVKDTHLLHVSLFTSERRTIAPCARCGNRMQPRSRSQPG